MFIQMNARLSDWILLLALLSLASSAASAAENTPVAIWQRILLEDKVFTQDDLKEMERSATLAAAFDKTLRDDFVTLSFTIDDKTPRVLASMKRIVELYGKPDEMKPGKKDGQDVIEHKWGKIALITKKGDQGVIGLGAPGAFFLDGLKKSAGSKELKSAARQDSLNTALVTHLNKEGGKIEAHKLVRSTDPNSPDTATVLEKLVPASTIEKQFGKPDKIEKDTVNFVPVIVAGRVQPPLKGEYWRYGRVALFIVDGNVLQFAQWTNNGKVPKSQAKKTKSPASSKSASAAGKQARPEPIFSFEPLGKDIEKVINAKAQLELVNDEVEAFATGFTLTADTVPMPKTGHVSFEVRGVASQSEIVVKVGEQKVWIYDGDRKGFISSAPVAIPGKDAGAKVFKMQLSVGKGPFSLGGIQTFAIREVKEFAIPEVWPELARPLRGSNKIVVKNPNEFFVRAGVRSGRDGTDTVIGAGLSESFQAPNGRFDVYFQYPTDENSVYQGDSFDLQDKGIEIEIVKVVDGNYGVRKLK